MSVLTKILGLLKKDPVTDGDDTFNIDLLLNDNWDKIDNAIGNLQNSIPDVSEMQTDLGELTTKQSELAKKIDDHVSNKSNPHGITAALIGALLGIKANGTAITPVDNVVNIPAASTSVYGVVKLSGSVTSTSTALASTPAATKKAYDLANSKAIIADPIIVDFPATGWVQNGTTGCYEQTVVCGGLLASDGYKTRVEPVGDASDADAQALTDAAYSMMDYVACNADGVLYARCPDGAPEVAFSVAVVIAR